VIRATRLDPGDERNLIRRAAATGQRLLGADPVSEPVPRICRRFRERNATLLALYDESDVLAVAAYTRSGHNERQADVDLVPLAGMATSELVAALLDHLRSIERVVSFVKLVEYDDRREDAFRGCGFVECGRLRRHTFAQGCYHDQVVLHAAWPDAGGGRA
jgi:hypothetical protein